ncbi:MAG: glycosyltransferase [Bacteroidales bacterium]|nr:glycosyltransferase [Bacteroidales bacterium]
MTKSKAIVSVINDLATDQRVDRACLALTKSGYEVLLVGRQQKNSLPLGEKPYRRHRMKLLFNKGPLFYAEYQCRLFLFLLFHKANLLYANDLDTLLPNYLISKIKATKLIYDSHELFCEVPELLENPKKRQIWKRLEQWIFPKLKSIITVNKSIADIYNKEYHKTLYIVRNIPLARPNIKLKTKDELGLPHDKKIIILQGAGINMERGAEEAVEAMQWVHNAILLIVGSGDVIELLKQMVEELGLSKKVIITGKVPYEQLAQYTKLSDLGLSLDKDTNLNYRYSLPNKLFDYIHANVPVLVSPLVEISRIVKDYNIGVVIKNHDSKHIANTINGAFDHEESYQKWKNNLLIAQEELSWENEEKQLLKCIDLA